MSLRQRLIDKAQSATSSRRIKLGKEGEEIEVEVRSPSLAASLSFTQESSDPQVRFRHMLKAVIACTHDPNSGALVFDNNDIDLLMELPAVEIQLILQPIVTAITELITAAHEAAKN